MGAEAAKPGAPDKRTSGSEGVTYERVLREAAALFRTNGYDATTTRALAERLGVKKASLYHHVSSKEKLLYDLCMLSMDDMGVRIEEVLASADGPMERLRALIRCHVATMLENPDPHTSSLLELRALTGEWRELVLERRHRYESQVAELIDEGQRSGDIRTDTDAHLLAVLMLGTMNWPILWYQPSGLVTPERLADTVCALALDGLRPRPDPSR